MLQVGAIGRSSLGPLRPQKRVGRRAPYPSEPEPLPGPAPRRARILHGRAGVGDTRTHGRAHERAREGA